MMGSTNWNDLSGAQIPSPTMECRWTICRSSGVSGPGLSRIESGTATLPMSCTTPACRRAIICCGESPRCFPSRAEYFASRSQCPSVYGSLPSILRASANNTVSARSSSSVYALWFSNERTRAMSCSRSTGLVMKSSAPALIPFTRSWMAVSPVTNTTGTSRVSGLSFRRRHTSIPSNLGICTSSRSMSGLRRWNSAHAASPSRAVNTEKPSSKSSPSSPTRLDSWSSAMRIVSAIGSREPSLFC